MTRRWHGALAAVLPALWASLMTAQPSPTRIAAIRCDARRDAPVPIAAPALTWRGDVVQWAEWPVRLGPNGVRNRLVVARMPASRVRFTLEIARDGGQMLPWSLEQAPADAQLAVNAGQFTDDGPWGWVVHKQRELQPPGIGALAGAFVVDSGGAVMLVTPDEIPEWRATRRAIEAVQSYPMLLVGEGRPPAALCDAAAGLDLTHRDARLAIGLTTDARGQVQVLFVLSRYEVPGGGPTRIPIGPTTPEMAEILRRLGAQRALMLDGGLSAQMLVRSAADSARWPGWRSVPLALAGRVQTGR